MKDNELRSCLVIGVLMIIIAEIVDELVEIEEMASEQIKEPEIALHEKVKEPKEVTVEAIEKAEMAFNEFIDERKVGEKKSHEELKIEEKPIVKKSPSKPRKELKRINPYRKPEEGPRKPVSGFRIKED